MIIKPLDGCGGEGVFHLTKDDRNVQTILEMGTRHGTAYQIAQRYIPEVRAGDKRIIVVDGEPVGAVLRVPQHYESRANFHVGGTAAKTPITARERAICARIGPALVEQGIVFAGIDVIGDWLTEVNVTSPTGIQEINRLDGVQLERLGARRRSAPPREPGQVKGGERWASIRFCSANSAGARCSGPTFRSWASASRGRSATAS